MSVIYHIIDHNEWDKAALAGAYQPESVMREGFIHCSYANQVLQPANNFYRGQTNLILLVIERDKVNARVQDDLVIEQRNGQEIQNTFPHIYGSLNTDAVTGTIAFPVNPDGSFSLPDQLKDEASAAS